MDRASLPIPLTVKTLDAIHVASAKLGPYIFGVARNVIFKHHSKREADNGLRSIVPHGGLMQITRLGLVVFLISLAVVSSASRVAAQKRVTTTITRLYTGADGQSHAADVEVSWRPAKLRAELNESESVKVTAAQFLRWPRGFVWEGHPASKRQYVIIVSGRGEVDVVGGKKVQLTPGRVLLAEDVTGKGHTTRVGADEDLVMLLVPLAQEP